MRQHLCNDVWIDGSVDRCDNHLHRGRSAPDVRPFDDRRTRLRIDGIASTGQVSRKGTVEHVDYWSGRVAATAKPATQHVKLMDLPWFRDKFEYRDGELVEKATGERVAWTQKPSTASNRNGETRKLQASTRQNAESGSTRRGVATGKRYVDLSVSNQPQSTA